jgi:hypothetical protein
VLHAPHSFTEEDCAFVARQARAQDQVVVIVRDDAAEDTQMPARKGATKRAAKAGSIWARLRVHAARDMATGHLKLDVRRGLSPRQLTLTDDVLKGGSF